MNARVVRYLDTPPTVAELDELCRSLGADPLDLCRTKEARFAELGLSKHDDRPRAEWLRLLAANPILLERPIVCVGETCVIGRPPDKVRALLP